jgi:putative flippase GtrA
MLAAWMCHRTLTFALTTKPSLAELARYVAAASTTALINYAVFAGLIVGWPDMPRLAALVFASCLATIFAYLSMRYGVFRRYRDG